MQDLKCMCSVQEAANHLGVSVNTVKKLIADEQLVAIRITIKKIRVSKASLSAYLAEQQIAPPLDDGVQELLRRERIRRNKRQ